VASDFLTLSECMNGFSITPLPVWVMDVDNLSIAWANDVALEFWLADSLEELTNRTLAGRMPESLKVRLQHTIRRVLAGEVFAEEWTFYPRGKACVVLLHLRAIILSNGRPGMLNQALKLDMQGSPAIPRALTMLRLSKAPVAFVNARGDILTQSADSVSDFGDTTSWGDWLGSRDVANRILEKAIADVAIEEEVELETKKGQRVHNIHAYAVRDPVTGELGVLIQHFDVTERIAAERLAQERFLKLREQQREILALSTPFLDVGARTLALPLIGHIDEARGQEITSRLLEMVANRGIERVILDITGVASAETSNLLFLRHLVDAISLLGARPIITGIRSDLARMLAASNESLSGITIKRSLAEGLRPEHSEERRAR
jgi:rsbT co-antagonist protein RsbR